MTAYVVKGLGTVWWFVTDITNGPNPIYILKSCNGPAPLTLLMSELEFRVRCYQISSSGDTDANSTDGINRDA